MIIAEEKKKSNIAEYILYMWQIEDLIRSHNFEMEAIEQSVINQFEVSVSLRIEIRDWYQQLVTDMLGEGIKEKGHLKMIDAYVDELNTLHHKLLTIVQDQKYQELYYAAKRNVSTLITKSQGRINNEIEACLTGLYGILVLKLKKKTVSKETQEAISTFSHLLAYLSSQYKKDVPGEVKLSEDRKN